MFNLTRHFSAFSFLLIALCGASMGAWQLQVAQEQAVHQAERENMELTAVVANVLWPALSALLQATENPNDTAHTPQTTALRLHVQRRLRELLNRTDTVTVKIYNRDGRTVFSTQLHELDQSMREDPGFQAALGGRVVSQMEVDGPHTGLDGRKRHASTMSSLVPLPSAEAPQAVLRVYHDVEPVQTHLALVQWRTGGVLLGCLAVLYLLQLLVVRRVHGVLRAQEQALGQTNRALDEKVQAHTQDLEATNQRLRNEVADRKRAEHRLDQLAHHDPLTGLPNCVLLREHLQARLSEGTGSAPTVAVLFINIDHFKDVNDSFGHSVGDELLMAVAERLWLQLGTAGTLSRIGGDEFGCLLAPPHPGDAPPEAAPQPSAHHTAHRLLSALRKPFVINDQELFIAASIGTATAPCDGRGVDELLRNANTAMYEAKAQGRDRVVPYTSAMTQQAQARMEMARLLRHALQRGELSLHYQPQFNPHTGALVGAEALMRWHSPVLGQVPPDRFIPVAENTGLIVPLGSWVIDTACQQLAAWQHRGLALPRVAVNVSAKQLLQQDLLPHLQAALVRHGLPPGALEVEITESVLVSVAGGAPLVLEQLRDMGVHLGIDDFGTGYSSLSYLRQMPIHTLKIDRCFVAGMGTNGKDEAIVRATLTMAKGMGLTTVAEGVETRDQLDRLRALDCDVVQGNHTGVPLPADAFWATWSTQGTDSN